VKVWSRNRGEADSAGASTSSVSCSSKEPIF
jgi:hypothetical protein